MTRINAGILPEELPSKLLLAELREIKRIPNRVCAGRYLLRDVPQQFTLGCGHVKFFYDKGAYTLDRYKSLRKEAIRREFNVQDFSSTWTDYPPHLFWYWEESEEARALIVARIKEKGFDLLPLTPQTPNQ